NVDEEHSAPTDVLDEPATDHGPDGRRDGAESRPRADRAATFIAVECRADDGEASWNEECGADALQGAAEHENDRIRRQPAEDGGGSEGHDTRDEPPLPSDLVAERSADENQGAEEERIGLDDPLHVGDRR